MLTLDENEDRIYNCFTKSEPVVECKSKSSVKAVKQIFNLLKIDVKKMWSGYEFFGFRKQDVLSNLN